MVIALYGIILALSLLLPAGSPSLPQVYLA